MENSDICVLVMGFLRHLGYHETLSALQLESNSGQGKMDEELLYLQKLTLQGRWDDMLRYLQPMRRILLHNFDILEFMMKKQQYLEALSWLGAGGQRHSLMPWRPPKNKPSTPIKNLNESCMTFGDDEDDIDMESVAVLLKELEGRCPVEDFNHLCKLLTLEKLCDDEKCKDWTVAQGRLQYFNSLRNALYKILPGDNEKIYEDDMDPYEGGRLRHLLTCGKAIEKHRHSDADYGNDIDIASLGKDAVTSSTSTKTIATDADSKASLKENVNVYHQQNNHANNININTNTNTNTNTNECEERDGNDS